MTETTLPATMQSTPEKRELALLRAVGLDRVAPEQREIALAIADRYGLDLMLKHLVLIEGRPYLTRDALLHIAHRSGQLDGMETTDPILEGEFWRASCTVYRKDMTRGFRYAGRYPAKGGNAKFAPEMALKVAESMALRRAFDIAAPAADERWDAEPTIVAPREPELSLAETARARAAAIAPAQDAPDAEEAVFVDVDATPEPVAAPDPALCGAVAGDGLMAGAVCTLDAHDKGPHKNADGSWPR